MESINNVCPTGILIDVNEGALLSCMNSKESNTSSDYYKSEMNLNKENALFDINCPTAVLIDISSNSDFFSKDKVCKSFADNCSKEDSIEHSPKLNESFTHRQRWKTPSPKSMSRISKEASRVIQNLNSSEIFDEDSPLTEEMLPIPIHFNIFDLEDNAEDKVISGIENNCKKEILKSSVSVQTQNIVIKDEINDETNFCDSENLAENKKIKNSSTKQSLETNVKNLKGFKELNSNSKELFSSENYSDSLNKSGFSATSDGTDDVFIAKQIPSEDKENIQRREHLVLSDDLKVNSPSFKVPFKSKTKLELRGTLRNLSNVTHEITSSTKCSLPNAKKDVTTSCRRMSLAKTKIIQPSTPKEQKSSLSVKHMTAKSDSLFKSSSSDPKQLTPFTKLKTPSKRYSISTPLKSSSAMKPPMTPSHTFHNPSRYTPQSVGNSRFSFSKSLQHSTGTSHFTNSKSMKHQSYTSAAGSTSTSKISSERLTFLGQRRQSFSQSMSSVSFQSIRKEALPTPYKSKCSGKPNLPSSLPVGQDRKLARVLFPSSAKK